MGFPFCITAYPVPQILGYRRTPGLLFGICVHPAGPVSLVSVCESCSFANLRAVITTCSMSEIILGRPAPCTRAVRCDVSHFFWSLTLETVGECASYVSRTDTSTLLQRLRPRSTQGLPCTRADSHLDTTVTDNLVSTDHFEIRRASSKRSKHVEALHTRGCSKRTGAVAYPRAAGVAPKSAS